MFRTILIALAATATLAPVAASATDYSYQNRYNPGATVPQHQTFGERYSAAPEGEIGTAVSTRCRMVRGRWGWREVCRIIETPGGHGIIWRNSRR